MFFAHRSVLALSALAALGLAGAHSAQAQTNVPLQNAGFEDPSLSPASFTTNGINGWNSQNSSGQATGVQTYSGTAVTPPADGGNQFGYINALGDVSQDTSATLTQGDTYTFAAEIGRRTDDPNATGTLELLTTDGTVLATSAPLTATLGGFSPESLSYTAANPTLFGKDVTVQINSTDVNSQLDFDNATLTVTPPSVVPESSGVANLSGALLALALGGAVMAVKKKKAA